MAGHPVPALQAGHWIANRPPLRSVSPTRSRLINDDLLSLVSPSTTVDALRSPEGPLRACMDAAGPSEKAFAMRCAVTSRKIQDWLDELSSWPWPRPGVGSSGFEMPSAKRRKVSGDYGSPEDLSGPDKHAAADGPAYIGCLLETQVVRYGERVDEITQDMVELNIEEIKSHVLQNHIIPLSRPGTPMSESSRSVASCPPQFTRLDDLTAVITTMVIQTLPNLSRLFRLLNIWKIRLKVLRRVPKVLAAITNAEVTLQSAWAAIEMEAEQRAAEDAAEGPSDDEGVGLTRQNYETMRKVIEKTISKPGGYLDDMLDTLEGMQDTLPHQWLDRMDNVEKNYAEWAATCERMLREVEWSRIARETKAVQSTDTKSLADSAGQMVAFSQSPPALGSGSHGAPTPYSARSMNAGPEIKVTEAPADDSPRGPGSPRDFNSVAGQNTESVSVEASPSNPAKMATEPKDVKSFDGPDDSTADNRNLTPITVDLDRDFDEGNDSDQSPLASKSRPMDAALEGLAETGEPTLPQQQDKGRRNSDVSDVSTVIHGSPIDPVDDILDPDFEPKTSPELPALRDMERPSSNTESPSSSPPPHLRLNPKSSVVSFNDTLDISEAPEELDPPKTPDDNSYMEEESGIMPDSRSPSRASITSTDDQLQRQISDILQSVPANIRLSNRPAPINLNPPDLNLPHLKNKKPNYGSRPTSGLSSRSTTPGYLLAPASGRDTPKKPRAPRSKSEVKLYHLSRTTGEQPIKLFIRLVGEGGERVMVRVGGGWADLGEYLKEYASHHIRRSGGEGRVEIRDLHRGETPAAGSSPRSRPGSAMDSPITPLNVRKTRRSMGEESLPPRPFPKTPFAMNHQSSETPTSEISVRSRSSSRVSWAEEDSLLGLAGPTSKKVEMSDESRAWVESIKEKVRVASGERMTPETLDGRLRKPSESLDGKTRRASESLDTRLRKASESLDGKVRKTSENLDGRFGEINKVGGTKRLFRKG